LDLSKNQLDFLPNDLLLDLDSLANLWVTQDAGTLLREPHRLIEANCDKSARKWRQFVGSLDEIPDSDEQHLLNGS
jgi:hypothetical protein